MKATLKAIQMKTTPDTIKKDRQVLLVKTGLRPGKKRVTLPHFLLEKI